MRTPEVAHFGIQVNEFDAVREPVMRNLDVFVMQPVTFQVTRMDAMQECLLDTRFLRMAKQMRGKARSRHPMPEACRTSPFGVVEIQAKRYQLSHGDEQERVRSVQDCAETVAALRRARRQAGMSAKRMPAGMSGCFAWPTRCAR